MRLVIGSDIHTDHWWEGLEKICTKSGDVCIVAGDLGTHSTLKDTLEELGEAKYKHVLYVLGNHDYIEIGREYVHAICEEMEHVYPHMKRLENRTVEIEGKKFHGGTLWYSAPPTPGFFDFAYIPGIEKWYRGANKDTKDFLLENVNPGDIVITHHAPSWKSVQPRWKSYHSNQYFVCPEMERIVEATQPSLYIHGHMHDSFSYHIHKTIVHCHPCGYPGENPNWKPKILNIEEKS